jgi:hypothetical protein
LAFVICSIRRRVLCFLFMLTSRRDYILRIIDEVSRLLARVIFKHRTGAQEEALQAVVEACERLFSLEASQLFQFTPEQHFVMLTRDEPPEIARDKVLLYAALNLQASRAYAALGNRAMERATLLNALRFTLKGKISFPAEGAPSYTPDLDELVSALGRESLDAETAELLAAAKGC